MHSLTARQWLVLALLTVVWGLNWPIMKMGVTGFPPLTFRFICLLIGTPVLGLGLWAMKVPFQIPKQHWRELLVLSIFNMFIWHALIILAVQYLSSGRSAILGYTMPIFSALIGAWVFKHQLAHRAWGGVAAAALGVVLLLWHELSNLSGKPIGVVLALIAASTWALGTQLLRRTSIPLPTLTLSFWMTAMTTVVMGLLSFVFEFERWQEPSATHWAAILYNAVLVFGFAHAAWFYLARSLPPVASTLSVMMIPILGVFSGAWALNEILHWQDWAAMALMVVSIASVLWPAKPAPTQD
ncbi:MAG: EamA family transporter [Betaproteobacteria bacterium]|jgi:drug/metabolite transporter (DMT)-like permease|nr:EamA family transporter [Betaproteobacteria bacterium]NBZ99128.1 EamA family transporter [Betaproteobacteria bacterium]NDD01553.1 EamA family transporter [Betaproteobacteria bacterium]NDD23467.1 EamA family transporter [Betaproteobacteria bacterium]NDE24105.1 EamA family transporter [Betaproteobacteria bacterium]